MERGSIQEDAVRSGQCQKDDDGQKDGQEGRRRQTGDGDGRGLTCLRNLLYVDLLGHGLPDELFGAVDGHDEEAFQGAGI